MRAGRRWLTTDEMVRAGRELAASLGRPITEDELRAVVGEIAEMIVTAAALKMWQRGQLVIGRSGNDYTWTLREHAPVYLSERSVDQ